MFKGELNNFLAVKRFIFHMFEYFCLESEVKIEKLLRQSIRQLS